MKEKCKKVKEMLKKNNQQDILRFYNIIDNENKEKFLDKLLSINFEQINNLYKKVLSEEKIKASKISPIEFIDKYEIDKEEFKEYELIGEKIIKQGKYAVVTMAGGQGSRLGHNGPKGTFDFGLESHKSIFEVLCDSLKEAYNKYGTYINWYIMTSKQNNDETIAFFEENNYFNYNKENISFFKQGELPVLDEQGKLMLDKNENINEAADGHGGIFTSMRDNEVINNMKKKGIEWIFIGPVDNVLVKMADPIFIGICKKKNVLAGGKSIVKAYPEEKVGVFCKKDGRPGVIEYTEISEEMANSRDKNGQLLYGESHINCNIFNIDIVDELSKDKLPYHYAHKKIEYLDENKNIIIPKEPNSYKFEAFIFDAFQQLDDMAILRVKREEEFAPIKNAEGNDSPQTAIKLYKNFYNI